jgi:hypothetical protein
VNLWGGLIEARKEDLEVPMIGCSIYDCYFEHALYDLGASVNIMPKVIFKKLQYLAFSPTFMCMQLTESTV